MCNSYLMIRNVESNQVTLQTFLWHSQISHEDFDVILCILLRTTKRTTHVARVVLQLLSKVRFLTGFLATLGIREP